MSKKKKVHRKTKRRKINQSQSVEITDNEFDILNSFIDEDDLDLDEDEIKKLETTFRNLRQDLKKSRRRVVELIKNYFETRDIPYGLDEVDTNAAFIVSVLAEDDIEVPLAIIINEEISIISFWSHITNVPEKYAMVYLEMVNNMNRTIYDGAYGYDRDSNQIGFAFNLPLMGNNLNEDTLDLYFNEIMDNLEENYPKLIKATEGEFSPEIRSLLTKDLKNLLKVLKK